MGSTPCIAAIALLPDGTPAIEVFDAHGTAIAFEPLHLPGSAERMAQGIRLGQAVNQLVRQSSADWILLWAEASGSLVLDWAAMTPALFCCGHVGAETTDGGGWLLMHRKAFELVNGSHPLLSSALLLITDCHGRLEAQGLGRVPPLENCIKLRHCSRSMNWPEALDEAQRAADLEADAALLVRHPWGLEQTMELPASLQRKWLRIWRLQFWSVLLLLPERVLKSCPESWFPSPVEGRVDLQPWQRLYWRWFSTGITQLERFLLASMRVAGVR